VLGAPVLTGRNSFIKVAFLALRETTGSQREPAHQTHTLTNPAGAEAGAPADDAPGAPEELTPWPSLCIKSPMQLETFQMFYDLAQTRSLTATARHFHLTRKAARRQLALLEREFKTGLADCHFDLRWVCPRCKQTTPRSASI